MSCSAEQILPGWQLLVLQAGLLLSNLGQVPADGNVVVPKSRLPPTAEKVALQTGPSGPGPPG